MLRRVAQSLVVFCLFSAPVFSQSASYVFSGGNLACKGHPSFGPNWKPKLEARSLPRLGGRLDLTVDSAISPGQIVLLLTGFSNKRFGQAKLPFDPKTVLPGPWCGQLMTSIDIVIQVGGSVNMHIPNDKALMGLAFYQQTFQNWTIIKGQFSLSWLGNGVIGT